MNKEFTDEFFKMYWKVENWNWINNFQKSVTKKLLKNG